jgi:glycosyltransferase involved in cell wall biosynthesis
MNVSVVVPTLDEIDNLPNCLDHLSPQLAPGDEVVIVDGGSEDSTRNVALDYGCVLVEADGFGIGTARAIGVEVAQNEIIVSTDADALPPEGWLDRIKGHFESNEDLVVLWGNIEDRNGAPIRSLVGKFSTLARGASGNNTAFRKSAYEQLEHGYPDVSFMEDVFIINQLAKMGEARRDKNLVMVMNMDRERYQTLPMVAGGAFVGVAGLAVGGKVGEIVASAGASTAITELIYENFTGTTAHHDEVGMGAAIVGHQLDEWYSNYVAGAGVGLIAHHVLTEGLSLAPTELMQHTDVIIDN